MAVVSSFVSGLNNAFRNLSIMVRLFGLRRFKLKKHEIVKPSEGEVQNALSIILSDHKSYTKSLNYAVNYVRQGKEMHGRELEVQCLYILNNIAHWHHTEAVSVRNTLKMFCGIVPNLK